MTKRLLKTATISMLFLAGCEVGPNYHRPSMPTPEAFGEATTRPTSRPAVSMTTWWDAFDDPMLNQIIEDAARHNLDVRAATARILEARAQRGVVAADWWPTVNTNGAYSRRRSTGRSSGNNVIITGGNGTNTGNGGANGSGTNTGTGTGTGAGTGTGTGSGTGASTGTNTGAGGTGTGTTTGGTGAGAGTGTTVTTTNTNSGFTSSRYGNLFNAGFDMTWELDIFGAVSRNVEAANADIQAAVEDRRDVLVTLLAEVARDYIDLRGAQRDLTITNDNLRSQQDTLKLTQERFRAGISSDLDVARAEAQVETTASTVPTLEAQIRQLIHAISVLTGKDPEALSPLLTPPRQLIMELPAIPLGMPSDLLRNRPDVRRAERQLAAATARIGVATADLFPRFSLTGSYAWTATKANKLFTDAGNFWSIGPSVSWPIFDAGRIRANIEVQNARQEEALMAYEKAVLTAEQEVEDAIVAYDREQARRIVLARAVASNQRAVDLSRQLYSRGLIDFLSVLDAERQLFIAQDLLVRSDTTVTENLIALYKALGGGWDQQPPPNVVVTAKQD